MKMQQMFKNGVPSAFGQYLKTCH